MFYWNLSQDGLPSILECRAPLSRLPTRIKRLACMIMCCFSLGRQRERLERWCSTILGDLAHGNGWIVQTETFDLGVLLGDASSGLEPFDPRFTGQGLAESARGRRVGIKQWLMSGSTVVGVGNIYACEALFNSGIHPLRKASAISRVRYDRLANAVRQILQAAIDSGGSTIQNFVGLDGEAGRYGQKHCVYGREGEPCPRCSRPIRRRVIGQRSTFFCHGCQR